MSAALEAIAALPVFFLFFLMCLALGTFLPPVRSLFNIFSSVLVSVLLTFYFNRRLQGRGHGAILAALGLLGLGCLVLMSVIHSHWHARAEDVRRTMDISGFPVTLAQFQEALPDGQYAYPRLAKAIETDFDPAFLNKIVHAEGAARWTAETARTEAAYAAHYAPYLERELAPLLKQKYARFLKVDYAAVARDPFKAPEPGLGKLSSIAKAARLSAVSAAVKGDTAKAWELVRLQFALSDVLANEKFLLGKMVALGIRGQGLDSVAGILLNRPGAVIPKDLRLRLRAASGGDTSGSLLKGEVAYQYDLYNYFHGLNFSRFREIGGSSAFLMSGPGGSGRAGLALEYLGFSLLRRFGVLDMNSMASAGYFSTIAEAGSWAEVSARNREAEGRVNSLPSWPYLLAKISLPSYSRVLEREFVTRAKARLTLVCAELLRYRREHGKYPKNLSELGAGETAADVFVGGEFYYAPAAGGFDLCSAGAAGDRKDNLGKDLCVRQHP